MQELGKDPKCSAGSVKGGDWRNDHSSTCNLPIGEIQSRCAGDGGAGPCSGVDHKRHGGLLEVVSPPGKVRWLSVQ